MKLAICLVISSVAIAAWMASSRPTPTAPATTVPESPRPATATEDPHRALRQIQSPQAQIAFAENHARTLLENEGPDAATRWAAGIETKLVRRRIFESLGRAVAANGVAAADDWLASVSDPTSKRSGAEGIAWALASTDLDTAFAWAAEIDDPESLQAVAIRISKIASIQNPQRSLEWAATLPDGATRDQTVRYGVARLADADLDAAMDWVARADPYLTEIGVEEISRSIATSEPKAGIDWIMQFDEPSTRERVVISIAQHWSAVDPPAAATWATTIAGDHPGLTRTVLERTFPIWRAADKEAADAWASALPPGQARTVTAELLTVP